MGRVAAVVAVAVAALVAAPIHGRDLGSGAPARSHEASDISVRPAGTLVWVAGTNRLTAVDVASGRRTVRRMRSLAACGPELYVTSGRVVFAGLQGERTVVFSLPISLKGAPKRLGAAHAFVPSATEGRVWLAGLDCDRPALIGVREVTVDGDVTFRDRRRVPGTWLVGAVNGGLVLQQERALAVWDPRRPSRPRGLRLEAVTEGHGSLVAGCVSDCRELVIANAETGRTLATHPERGYQLDLGVDFSPDGKLLAAAALAGRRWSVALVDTRDGSTTIVPGSGAGRTYPAPSWASSSGWLFFLGRGGRVMAYRPGARRAVKLPFRLPRAVSFTAG